MSCETVRCVRPAGHDGPCLDGMLHELPSRIQVRVCSLAGLELDVDINIASTVGELKDAISRDWHISPLCQNLCFEDSKPNDSVCLGDLCSRAGQTLQLTLIINLKEVCQNLQHPDTPMRIEALDILRTHAKRGNGHVIDAVRGCLVGGSVLVSVAVSTLAALGERGDQQIIGDLLGLMHLVSPHKQLKLDRLADVLDALSQIAQRPDDRVVAAALAHINRREDGAHREDGARIRCAAILALIQAADVGDQDVVTALLRCLASCEDPSVVKMAEIALITLAEKGDQRVVMRLKGSPVTSAVRHAVVEALRVEPAEGVEAGLVIALQACAEDSHEYLCVRKAAAQALSMF